MSDQKDNIFSLPSVLNCPACDAEINFTSHFQNGGRPNKKGDVVICSECGTPSRIGDSNLHRMTKEELAALDKQSRSVIALTVASIRQRKKTLENKFDKN